MILQKKLWCNYGRRNDHVSAKNPDTLGSFPFWIKYKKRGVGVILFSCALEPLLAVFVLQPTCWLTDACLRPVVRIGCMFYIISTTFDVVYTSVNYRSNPRQSRGAHSESTSSLPAKLRCHRRRKKKTNSLNFCSQVRVRMRRRPPPPESIPLRRHFRSPWVIHAGGGAWCVPHYHPDLARDSYVYERPTWMHARPPGNPFRGGLWVSSWLTRLQIATSRGWNSQLALPPLNTYNGGRRATSGICKTGIAE
jgi:hypothetical protein